MEPTVDTFTRAPEPALAVESQHLEQRPKSPELEISVIIPAYNEEANVGPLYEELRIVLDEFGRSSEIIFVDDGSVDGTYEKLAQLHQRDPRVKVVQFRGNFGKAAAYSAGFEHAVGRYVVTMDADLQDDPRDLVKLVRKLDEGYDFVSGWKHRGKGTFAKRAPSKCFNAVVRRATGIKLHDMDCPFRAMRREVLQQLKIYGDLYRYIPIFVAKNGFRIAEVRIENRPRVHGESKFGAERFLRGGLDLFTVLFLTRYLARPLHLFGAVGLIVGGLGMAVIGGLYFSKLVFGILILNTPFLFALGVLAMILGLQLFSLGLVSQLIIELHKHPGDNYQVERKLW